MFWRFFSLPHTSIRVEVIGKRVNRGGGYGLEIPVRYHIEEPPKAILWPKKRTIEAVNVVEEKVKKFMENAV